MSMSRATAYRVAKLLKRPLPEGTLIGVAEYPDLREGTPSQYAVFVTISGCRTIKITQGTSEAWDVLSDLYEDGPPRTEESEYLTKIKARIEYNLRGVRVETA